MPDLFWLLGVGPWLTSQDGEATVSPGVFAAMNVLLLTSPSSAFGAWGLCSFWKVFCSLKFLFFSGVVQVCNVDFLLFSALFARGVGLLYLLPPPCPRGPGW